MEIFLLQQLEHQANQGGSSATGIDAVFVKEGNNTNGTGSYTSAPAIGLPRIINRDYRTCWPSTGSWSTTKNIQTRIHTETQSNPIVLWLASGMIIPNETHTSNHTGLSHGPRMFHLSDQGEGGTSIPWMVPNNNQSYGPIYASIFFVRNRDTQTRTFSYNATLSSYWNSGHDGAGVSSYLLNNSTLSQVTDCTFTNHGNYQGSTTQWSVSPSLSIPAGRTAAFLHCGTMYYWTTYSSGGIWWYQDTMNAGQFNNGSYFEPDLKMTAAFYFLRDRNTADLTTHTNAYQDGKALLAGTAKMAGEYFGDHA